MFWTKLVFVLLPLLYNVKAADDYIKWALSQKPEDIKVINLSQDSSLPLDLSTLSATALPGSTVYVVLLNGNSEKQDVKTDEDSNTEIIIITTPQPPTGPIEISPSYIELPARQEPRPTQKVVSPAPQEPVRFVSPKPATSWTPTEKPLQVRIAPPTPPPTEPAYIWRKEPGVESLPPNVIKIVLPSKEPATPKPVVKETVIVPSKRRPITLPNSRPEPEDFEIMVAPQPEMSTKAPAIIVEPKPAKPKPTYIEHKTSPSYIELPARQEPRPTQKVVSPGPQEPVRLVSPKPATSWTPTEKPLQVRIAPPTPPPTEPAYIWRKEPAVESRPPSVIEIVLASKEPATPKPEVKETVIVPSKRRPITLPNSRPEPEDFEIMVAPQPEMSTKAPAIIVEPKPAKPKPTYIEHKTYPSYIELPARKEPIPTQKVVSPASREPVRLVSTEPATSWTPTEKPLQVRTVPSTPPPTEPAYIWRKEPAVESRPPSVIEIVLLSKEPATPKPEVKETVIVPSKRRPITLPNSRPEPEDFEIMVAPQPEMSTKAPAIIVEPKPSPAPAKPVVVYHQPTASPAPPASKVVAMPAPATPQPTYIFVDQKPKPTPTPVGLTKLQITPSSKSLPPSPTPLVSTHIYDYSCNDANGYYRVAEECDTYVECKKHAARKFTCPEGLHFNPNVIWPEYPCGYPWEVQCEINAHKQQPMPSSECPHQYGYYALAGDCGKYVMCQEGRAIVMNCPPGLSFNDFTSTCDWPENVPTCNLEMFDGFNCPSPPTDEYGDLLDVIYKYRYGQSCREYVACQHGWPRLLSCDAGSSFDEDSQVCVDSEYVPGCRS